jgi:uracil-DNA glycosylase
MVKETLAKHCRALVECRLCGHPEAVTPIVSVAVRPKVMIVGQAPGQVEAAGGKPFAGRAGKTLFRWLERAGIDETTARNRIYIAAVTRCYPGPSPSGRGDRVPSPREQETCSVWLESELRIIRPKLIVPVGKLAMERFLPRLPLDQLIGGTFDVEHAGGVALAIPLPHPSGASSWVHQGNHPELLDRALARLKHELASLGVIGPSKTRSVA